MTLKHWFENHAVNCRETNWYWKRFWSSFEPSRIHLYAKIKRCVTICWLFLSHQSIYYFFCLIPLATLTSLLALSALFSVLHYFLPSFSGRSERLILSHARTTHRVESFLFFSSRLYNKSLWDSNVVFNLFSCFESLRFLFCCFLLSLLSLIMMKKPELSKCFCCHLISYICIYVCISKYYIVNELLSVL